MKTRAVAVVAFLALAGLIGFIVRLPSGGGGGGAKLAMTTPVPGGPVNQSGGGPGFGGVDTGGVAFTTATSGSGGGGGSGGGSSAGEIAQASGPVPAPAHAVSLPRGLSGISQSEFVGPRIVKTAQLALVTKRGDFQDAFDRAVAIARQYRGFIESSSTQGVRAKSGHITIRVPETLFESALRDLRALGRVQGQSIQGQDVTSQFVDLQARLRNWQSQERVLLRLMGKATTIGETLRVQNELQTVQLRIEELKGQLRVLDDQTSLGTIDVSMRESGTPVQPVKPENGSTPSLAGAWDDAVDGFLGVLVAVVVGLGYLVPIAALLALVWLGVRRLRPRVAAES